MPDAFVGIGSNVKPDENVRRAVRLLSQEVHVAGVSTVYETEAEGRPEQPRYYNCVVEIETEAPPGDLKRSLRGIEDRMGRERSDDRYAPRIIDLDLLMYDDLTAQSEEMTLPHPDIGQRPYLAVALAELAPGLMIPGTKTTLQELAQRLPEKGMRPLDEYTNALRREVA
jgi:2-amino-4-hydroxy-6-hydroxymethyldihydropteridine diphosphokinase